LVGTLYLQDSSLNILKLSFTVADAYDSSCILLAKAVNKQIRLFVEKATA
jgi:hypothetical protein